MHLPHLAQYVVGLLQYAETVGPGFIYLAVFVISLIESVPIIGTLTPGTLLLLTFGFISSQGHANVFIIVALVAIGSVIGDTIAYYLGKYGFTFFSNHRLVLKYGQLKSAQAFFNKHGGKSVLFARFVGPIRPIVPLLAGALDMPIQKFLLWNVSGSIAWASIYITLGYFFGRKWQFIEVWLSRLGFIGFFIVMLIVLLYIMKEKKTQEELSDVEAANAPEILYK